MKVLVTGASGFIGSHLVPTLLSDGYTPVAFVRRSSKTSDLNKMGVETRVGDLRDYSSLQDAVCGIDVVIHLAAYYTFYGKKEIYQKINVEGTSVLAEEAKREALRALQQKGNTTGTSYADMFRQGFADSDSTSTYKTDLFHKVTKDKIYDKELNKKIQKLLDSE